MSVLAICHPLPFALLAGSSSAGAGLSNLLTEEPREAFTAAAGGTLTVAVDLGSIVQVDTFFLGHADAPADTPFAILPGLDGNEAAATGTFAHSYRRAPLRHACVVLDTPIATRYVRFRATTQAALTVGTIAVGRSIRPGAGHEWNSGRPVTDGSRVERLPGGGFGIGRGAIAGGWQFTMIALTDEETERLYALQLDAGIQSTVLVVEDPDVAPALNERIHWGLLTRLEPFARQAPGENKWSMQVWDWA